MDVGAKLQSARERRGLSLDHLSRSTKISLAMLEALEQNDLDRLPATIYTRGFVKAYAREVGLDPDDTVARYLAQFEVEPAIVETGRHGAHQSWAEAATGPKNEPHLDQSERRAPQIFLLVGALTIAVGLGGYFTVLRWQERDSGAEVPVAGFANSGLASSNGPPPAGMPAGTGALAAQAREAAGEIAAPAVLQFDIHPEGPCWLSAAADGSRAVSRLMQAGERQTIEVRKELVLRIGDPGAFAFSVNGMPGRPLGRSGEVVTVRITPQNVRDFLLTPG